MDYLSIAHEEEMAFIQHCKNYLLKYPEDDSERHFNYLYNSTRERIGFLHEYRLKSKFCKYYYKITLFKGEAQAEQILEKAEEQRLARIRMWYAHNYPNDDELGCSCHATQPTEF